jgi:pyrophosphatase PpaX
MQMKPFTCVLFDLDGTLIDTTPLIMESFRHTFLYHFDYKISDEELLEFLGIPLRKPFEDRYPGMEEILIKTYKEFNERKHDAYVGIFIGIEKLLSELKEKGVRTGIVTSKRRELALRGMQLFGIDRDMSVFVYMEDTIRHKPEGDPILKALEQLPYVEKESVLYVGDSSYDILCAKNAGVKSAAVAWSYIPRPSLEEYKPDLFLESPLDLRKYI